MGRRDAFGDDLSGALDKLQEMEAQNELLVLENQQAKEEILELQK